MSGAWGFFRYDRDQESHELRCEHCGEYWPIGTADDAEYWLPHKRLTVCRACINAANKRERLGVTKRRFVARQLQQRHLTREHLQAFALPGEDLADRRVYKRVWERMARADGRAA